MTAKEFLSQGYKLDEQITRKIEIMDSLNDMAAKVTYTITGMPKNPSSSKELMADTINKIVDLQQEINHDIDTLVDIKRDIMNIISQVDNTDHRILLEARYLCNKEWEEIAVEMHYGIRWIYNMHGQALGAVDEILKRVKS